MILSALFAATMMLADTTPAAATAATAATPAPATATPAAAGAADAAPKPPEDRLVCRSEPMPGTLMTKKVCYHVTPRRQADQPPAKAAPAGAN